MKSILHQFLQKGIIAIISIALFQLSSIAQTYDTQAAGYWELYPRFEENSGWMDIYFNLKFEDAADQGGDGEFDHLSALDIYYGDIRLYRVEHTSLHSSPDGSYVTYTFNDNRFSSDDFKEFFEPNAVSSISTSKLHTSVYNDTHDVSEMKVSFNIETIQAIYGDSLFKERFSIDAVYYDRGTSGASNDDAGHHYTHKYRYNDFISDTELYPRISNDGDVYNVYVSIEDWAGDGLWEPNYDHLRWVRLKWNNEYIFAATHSAFSPSNIDIATNSYSHSNATTSRWEAATSFNYYIQNNFPSNGITTTTTTDIAYGTNEVTTLKIEISKAALAETLGDGTLTLEGEYYMRKDGGSADPFFSGTHEYTSLVQAFEEDAVAADEMDFTAEYVQDGGLVKVSFRGETFEGEDIYDHLGCIQIHAENLSKGTDQLIAVVGHTSSTFNCSDVHEGTQTSFSGNSGDTYISSSPVHDEVLIQPATYYYDGEGDGYKEILHYYANNEHGDDIRYYAVGGYYARDRYDQREVVSLNWQNNESTVTPSTELPLPTVTGLVVTPSTTDCEIDISWTPYTPFGEVTKNRVAVYRDGTLIATVDPQSASSFTDTDIAPGVSYSYQVASLYGRYQNGDLVGSLSAAELGEIEILDAPVGLTTAQANCDGGLTIDWVWQGATSPDAFIVQRQETGGTFQTIDGNYDGSLRSYTDNNIVEGIQYTYRIAGVGGPCSAAGEFSPGKTHTRDTLDLRTSIAKNGVHTSKGYYGDRTELVWELTGENEEFVNRFRIYARELGTDVVPSLIESPDRDDRNWMHETGNAGTIYEYFVVTERVIETECGFETTSSYAIESVVGMLNTYENLPDSGVAYSIGFRSPTAVINGSVTYEGGIAVPDVKIVIEPQNEAAGKSLYFNGNSYVTVDNSPSLQVDTALTLSVWIKPENLGVPQVILDKSGSYGLEYAGSGTCFFFIRDEVDQDPYRILVPAGNLVEGNWINLMATYSAATGRVKLYINGELSSNQQMNVYNAGSWSDVSEVPADRRNINLSTTPFIMGMQNDDYFYQGHMDEIRIYNKALSDEDVLREYGRLTAPNSPGLVAYWKIQEGAGKFVYDAAHVGTYFYQNEGTFVRGVQWSDDIPSRTQLGIAGYTSANGSYTIEGIPYSGTGQNFQVIPTVTLSGVVHEFDPLSRTIYLGEGSRVENQVDFVDISTFSIAGRIVYDFEDEIGLGTKSIGSPNVEIYLDGVTPLTDANDNPITTDHNGFFDVEIPIGYHYLTFEKADHQLSSGGRWPAAGYFNIQQDFSGIELFDLTTHKFVGTVAGGTKNQNLAIFGGEQVNNIGQAYFELTSDNGIVKRTVETDTLTGTFEIDLPPLTYNFSPIKWAEDDLVIVPSGDISPLQLGNESAYNGLFEIDSMEVPELNQIYPTATARAAIDDLQIDSINETKIYYSWTLTNNSLVEVTHKWIGLSDTTDFYNITNGGGFATGAHSHEVEFIGNNAVKPDSSLPAAIILVYETATGEELEVGVKLNFVSSSPLAYYDTTGYTMGYDTTHYNARRDFTYRTTPSLEVKTEGDTLFWGERSYSYNTQDTIILIDIDQLPYPTFFSNMEYSLNISAAEIYTNKDNQREYRIPVTDGNITVNSSIGFPFTFDEDSNQVFNSGSQLALDEDGTVLYQFRGGDPNITQISSIGEEHNSFTYSINVVLDAGSNSITWPADPTNNPQRAYVMGRKTIAGSNFITEAPETVEFILRDPPGSNSYAFREAGSSYSASEEFAASGFGGLGRSLGGGADMGIAVGGSFVAHGEVSGDIEAEVSVGVRVDLEATSGTSVERSVEMTETISTNEDAIEVGSGDVFVAKSQNLETGIAIKVLPVPLDLCGGNCFGDTITLTDGSQYQMGLAQESYVGADGLPTYAIYSQNHIETVLIPDLEELRNSILVNHVDYTSNLNPLDSLYGSNNDDPRWGAQASSSNIIRTDSADIAGPSYVFNNAGDYTRADSVRYFNQQIRLWQDILALNEIEKWAALQSAGLENVSLASGVTLERTTTNTASSLTTLSFETTTAVEVNLNVNIDAGVAISANADAEVGVKTNTTSTRGEESSNTIGYVLLDPDENDALSINIAPGVGGNGPIFSTVAGQTSCPHEPALEMRYATPLYIERAILEKQNVLAELEKSKNLTEIIAAQIEEEKAKVEQDIAQVEQDIRDFADKIRDLAVTAADASGIQSDVEELLLGVVENAPGLMQSAVAPVVAGVNDFIGSIQDFSLPLPFGKSLAPFESIPQIPMPENPTGDMAIDLGIVEQLVAERMRDVTGVAKDAVDAGNELIIRLQKRLKDRLLDLNAITERRLALELDMERIDAEIAAINNQIILFGQLKTALENGSGTIQLSNTTLQREKPTLHINGAKTAQVFNVPADQNANFTLLLGNESESGDAMYYAIDVLDHTNPDGLVLRIDGVPVSNAPEFYVEGGSAISKVMTVERGPFEYSYEDVQIVIHSTCQYDPTGNTALIVDTVTFSVDFLPTCTDVEILSPNDQWTVNNSFENEVPVQVGGYDVNGTGFEKIKVQYKPASESDWVLLETYFRDSLTTGWAGEPTLPQTGNVFTHDWELGQLPDGDYDIRAVATCALAETNAETHTGTIDRLNPTPFGLPQPSDGILSPGEEISIQFNETINEGLLTPTNFDIRGVLNAGDIRHDASVYFDGASNNMTIESVNLANRSFSFDFYAKRTQDNVNQVLISQGADAANELSIGYNTSNEIYFTLGGQTLTASGTAIDNNWHHFAVTFDYSNADAIIYMDASDIAISNSFNPNYLGNEGLYIATSNAGSGANFQGNMHELRLWSKALSTGDVNLNATQRMIGNEAGLLHNWTMEEGHGIMAYDKVRGKHATVNANWVVEPLGFALRLNGEVDQAEISSPAFDDETDYTIEFWFNSDGGVDEGLISNGNGDANEANLSGWALGIDGSGYFYAKSQGETTTSSSAANDGQWHHVALVTKAAGNATLYLDATEVGSILGDSIHGFAGSELWIGQIGWYTGAIENNANQFNGSIDELRIWNTARSFDQIDRDRFNKLAGDEPGLVDYFSFEEYTTTSGITSVTSTLVNGSISNIKGDSALTITGTAALTQVTPTIKLERPVQPVNFTYVVNNDKIIITPNIDAWKIENVQLDFTVSNVKDLNGNVLVSPVTWSAYIDQNQVVWQDNQITLETEKGTALNFESTVLNNSGQSANYTISNVPSWLEATPASGSVGPLNSTVISFEVPETVNNGDYQTDVLLTTDFGYAEALQVNVKVKQSPPADWTVDPTQFQYSMNVIGQIAYNGTVSRNADDLLGVFVNDTCRGVASLDYLSSYDNYQAFLSVYSNTTSGEALEYRIWNAQTGAIHTGVSHTLPSTEFVPDAFYGTSASPELFDADNYLAGAIDVPAGWKWISFNLEGEDLDSTHVLLSSLNAADNDIIKTRLNVESTPGNFNQQSFFDTYSSSFNWTGSITQNEGVRTNVLYKVNMSHAGTIHYRGELVNPTEDTVHFVPGWNYLGYVGVENTPITEAMSNYTPTDGDVLKSQYQSAIYDAGMGWLGSLQVLEPNEGYMIQTAVEQDFTYPEYINGSNRLDMSHMAILEANPWAISEATFATNMTVIAKVKNDDEMFYTYHSNTGLVGAFVNGECRSVAYPQYHEESNSYIYVLTIGGNDMNENITFQYLDAEREVEHTAFEATNFSFDEVVGNLSAPFELTLSNPTGLNETNENSLVGLYPNPFSDKAVLTLKLTEAAAVNYTLEDVSGRILRSVSLGSQTAGTTQVELVKGDLPIGAYFLNVSAGSVQQTEKVIITK